MINPVCGDPFAIFFFTWYCDGNSGRDKHENCLVIPNMFFLRDRLQQLLMNYVNGKDRLEQHCIVGMWHCSVVLISLICLFLFSCIFMNYIFNVFSFHMWDDIDEYFDVVFFHIYYMFIFLFDIIGISIIFIRRRCKYIIRW